MNKKDRGNKKVPAGEGKKSSSNSSKSTSGGDDDGSSYNNNNNNSHHQQYDQQDVLEYVEQLEADAAEDAENEADGDEEAPQMTGEKKTTKNNETKNKGETIKKKTGKVSSSSLGKSSSKSSDDNGIGAKQPGAKSRTTKTTMTKKKKKKKKGKAKKAAGTKHNSVVDDDGDDVDKTSLRRSGGGANYETPGAFSVENGIVSEDDDDDDDGIDVEIDDLENQQATVAPPQPLTVSTVSQDYTLASSEPIVATLVVGPDDDELDNSNIAKPPIVTAAAEPLQETTQSTPPSFWKSKTFKVLVLIVVLLVIAIIVVVSLPSKDQQQSQAQASPVNGDGDDDDEGGGEEDEITKRCTPAPLMPGMDICNSQKINPVRLLVDDDRDYTTSSFNMRDWSTLTVFARFKNDAASDFTVKNIDVLTKGPNGVGGESSPTVSYIEGYPRLDRDFLVRKDDTFDLVIEVDLSETPCSHDRLFLKGQSEELGKLGPSRMLLLESEVECSD